MGTREMKAYAVNGKVHASLEEAKADAYGDVIETLTLREGQFVIDGKIVSLISQPPGIEYKVTWNTQEIPFWQNFEGAKACVLAINTNKNGNRARLISFMKEKEIEV